MKAPAPNFRFSGHETFPCRYAWLPKAVRHVSAKADLFADEEGAMVKLGLGKNMVRATKFWAEAAGVLRPDGPRASVVTDFGRELLGPDGYDEFLEKIQTLWLLHWRIASNASEPLFAWHHLLNHWHRQEFSRHEVLSVLAAEAHRLGKKLSAVTLEHHFTTFLHTYVPTKSRKNEVAEDNLDSPLVELELINKVGERTFVDSSRRESIYTFRLEEKPEISPALFVYCLADFWSQRHENEMTLTAREVCVGEGSPGQLLKLPEAAIRERLERIREESEGIFDFQETAAFQRVVKLKDRPLDEHLTKIYT